MTPSSVPKVLLLPFAAGPATSWVNRPAYSPSVPGRQRRRLRDWEMGHGRSKCWCARREEAEARVLSRVQQSSTAVVWVYWWKLG